MLYLIYRPEEAGAQEIRSTLYCQAFRQLPFMALGMILPGMPAGWIHNELFLGSCLYLGLVFVPTSVYRHIH